MQEALHILQQYWRYDRFRPLQEEIIAHILEKKHTVGLLPTGGGKSLCYQLPALLTDGLTLVISPLIALMQDQVQQLNARNIAAAFLHAGLRFTEAEDILEQCRTGQIKLLYISPERLQNRQFRDYLPALRIRLLAVDEAHCVSQWGHDFRPEYLRIKEVRSELKNVPLLALTASATPAVLDDILLQLDIPDARIFRKSFRRDNIYYDIVKTENKTGILLEQLAASSAAAIVYCKSRRRTEQIAQLLQQQGIPALAYHAGMPKSTRSEHQELWIGNQVQVMVATSAFGMGIDKADVATVIHTEPPESLEAYYQESGRAGRNGQAAKALILYDSKDITQLESTTERYYPPADYLRQLYQAVCNYLQIPVGSEPDKYYDFDLNVFFERFRFDALSGARGLRLLAREGLWSISDGLFRPATVQFIVDRSVLDELQQRYPLPALIGNALLRLYSGIFHYKTVVHPGQIARYLRMNKTDVVKGLQQLHNMQVISWEPDREGPLMHFHHYRVKSSDLIIDTRRIQRLKEQHAQRIEALTRYLQNGNTCKSRMLLGYFGETMQEDCGHCVYCTNKQHEEIPEQAIQEAILSLVRLRPGISAEAILSDLPFPRNITTEVLRTLWDMRYLRRNNKGGFELQT